MNKRKLIADEICKALARGNVPNLDDVDSTLDHLTNRNGALVAPLAHHQQTAMHQKDRRVNESLRKLVLIGSLMAENFRQMNASTAHRVGKSTRHSLAESWEAQLLKFRQIYREDDSHGIH